jgi:hypothetical protein
VRAARRSIIGRFWTGSATAVKPTEGTHFVAKRHAIRAALAADGHAQEIEILVATLLVTRTDAAFFNAFVTNNLSASGVASCCTLRRICGSQHRPPP